MRKPWARTLAAVISIGLKALPCPSQPGKPRVAKKAADPGRSAGYVAVPLRQLPLIDAKRWL